MLQAYCDEHGFTDGDVGVSLTFELAADPKRIAALVIDVDLPHGVPEDAKEELRQMTEGFPVPQTLRTPPQVDIDIS